MLLCSLIDTNKYQKPYQIKSYILLNACQHPLFALTNFNFNLMVNFLSNCEEDKNLVRSRETERVQCLLCHNWIICNAHWDYCHHVCLLLQYTPLISLEIKSRILQSVSYTLVLLLYILYILTRWFHLILFVIFTPQIFKNQDNVIFSLSGFHIRS